jgi:23S rRNA G2069 N7-methylase RlmK/C1962 C5-methylase RlmI
MPAVPLPDQLAARHADLAHRFTAEGTTAWRIIDEGGCTVDWYDGAVVVHARNGAYPDSAQIAAALRIDPALVFTKERRRQTDRQHGGQYQVVARAGAEREVRECGLAFAVNLSDYLDTGLFLDHRALRRRVGREAAGRRVLNLFAYTGAFTVHAAAGRARSTLTVDLSNTYLRWAERNLALNRLRGDHRTLKADCVRWLGEAHRDRFDLIICDPPTFSNSKAMAKSWEVERDQGWLLWRLWNLLAPGGTAYFSTNKHGFALTAKPPPFACVEDITDATIDPDVAGTVPHRCWRLVR